MPLSETGKTNPRLLQLRWKNIPGTSEWLAASALSSISIFENRNSTELRAIDAAVADYAKFTNMKGLPLGQESEALIRLFEAIEVYRATPRSHRKSRWDVVADLRAITLYVLSDIRWQKYKDVTGGHKPGMKPMVEHVWSEKHSPGHERVGHDPDVLQGPDPWLQGGKNADEKYLFEYLRKIRAENGGQQDNVKYVEDQERWSYQVVFGDDGFACLRFVQQKGRIIKEKRAPITTSGGDLGTCIYVVDEDDNFYIEPPGQRGQALNHCSFLQGRPVRCAGTIGISQGVVGYIDNASGHYRPSRQNLVNGVQALKKHASPVIFPWIIVRDASARYPRAAYEADKFLMTKGHCRPIGYYNGFQGRYDGGALVRFSSGDELAKYMSGQDQGIDRARALERFQKLARRLEYNDKTKGSLANDAERAIIQEGYALDLAPRTVLDAYCKNDAPMQKWLQNRLLRAYGAKIPANT
jgi:hypothetical protein